VTRPDARSAYGYRSHWGSGQIASVTVRAGARTVGRAEGFGDAQSRTDKVLATGQECWSQRQRPAPVRALLSRGSLPSRTQASPTFAMRTSTPRLASSSQHARSDVGGRTVQRPGSESGPCAHSSARAVFGRRCVLSPAGAIPVDPWGTADIRVRSEDLRVQRCALT
jgi:hypothetical protein